MTWWTFPGEHSIIDLEICLCLELEGKWWKQRKYCAAFWSRCQHRFLKPLGLNGTFSRARSPCRWLGSADILKKKYVRRMHPTILVHKCWCDRTRLSETLQNTTVALSHCPCRKLQKPLRADFQNVEQRISWVSFCMELSGARHGTGTCNTSENMWKL